MSSVPSTKLNSGYHLPLIGYGTFGGHDAPEQVYNAAKIALKKGYKHFDTAYSYQTENSLGNAVRESGVPREELFITTKLWQSFHEPQHVRPVLERSLEHLQMEYVDLYLMHWPFAWEFRGYEFADLKLDGPPKIIDVPIIDTWREMEKLVKDGKTRSIGVSNFTIPMLQDLLSKCEIPPAVNQIELHPCLPQEDMLQFCKENNIILTAFSPLGNPGYRQNAYNILDDPVVLKIAEKYNKTPVQVLLNYGVNRGYAVIPKSVTESRIEANLVYFEIDSEDVKALADIGKSHPLRTCQPEKIYGPDHNIFD
ncbi:hypothetical protein G6F56_001504 [Rhizopus delemar]|uniref:NADP-dependent oxidoreductase domain-containing protein n=1 Tax=Rhizopus stolonifer TaxID=4846 RepID=A0A367KPE8_RHIST|nr:hypothetical protein G6F56_001504 [Rhizopus delemar]RCI04115.1 hypothetical protein CU098_011006 [Rhizopus stolonifer]